ncbi:ornithine cyclodeaminase/mu-crystallin family protein [Mycobacterium xenopi 3993]|nr:ornithine cyclodeaminase/mu-crystallin family protein [Mycobacterium xenopi 3993]
MPGYDGGLHVSAFKDYYMQNDEGKKEYITITLYDDKAGAPIAFMDCTRVTTLRTAASTALIAAACAPRGRVPRWSAGLVPKGGKRSRSCWTRFRTWSGCCCSPRIQTGSPRCARICASSIPTVTSKSSPTRRKPQANRTSWWRRRPARPPTSSCAPAGSNPGAVYLGKRYRGAPVVVARRRLRRRDEPGPTGRDR